MTSDTSSVSTKTSGQCPTTLIWLGLGSENDLARLDEPFRIARSWWAMKLRFLTAQN